MELMIAFTLFVILIAAWFVLPGTSAGGVSLPRTEETLSDPLNSVHQPV